MEIWIIRDGEKTGPLPEYTVRESIERGDLSGDEMGWHDGSPDWMPLREMEVFHSNFRETEEAIDLAPPPLPVRPRPFLRLWARLFDLYLYLGFVFGVMRLIGLDLVDTVSSSLNVFLLILPWVVLEGIAIHLTGTTPGKWLLGIRVQRIGGGALELGRSVHRAVRVYIYGLGMNLPILREACQCVALWYVLKHKAAWWDRVGQTEVRVKDGSPLRTVIFVLSFFAVMMTSGTIMKPISDDMLEKLQKAYPELMESVPRDEA